ncbi:hypothetical protein AAFC00_006065 [Neodothiora populina]|uniref:Uncharacterized protein n=1 Tax=Neodothiora populina TaxID=2781224 RepID=A0ABR3P861_9PEZI
MADHEDHGISGWGIFFLVVFIVVIFASVGWIIFTQYRARRLGLPAPSLNPFGRNRDRARNTYAAPAPAPSGIKAWFTEKFDAIRGSGRTSGGGYESTGYGGGRNRHGFGALDPDEAWDARVGNEYYEEQELGLQDPNSGPYGGSGYGQVVGAEVERGRSKSRQRELDERYDEEMGVSGATVTRPSNPFGDDASASSLRGVSPRPLADTEPGASSKGHRGQNSLETKDDSPTERRSMFRENM